jgi:hypothetical protein
MPTAEKKIDGRKKNGKNLSYAARSKGGKMAALRCQRTPDGRFKTR